MAEQTKVTIQWHDQELVALLRRCGAKLIKQAALRIRNEAVKDAPVRGRHRSLRPGWQTDRGGVLKASIREEVVSEGDGVTKARVVTTCGYGAYVELGTSKMEARPFLLPAVDTARPAILKDIERALEKESQS